MSFISDHWGVWFAVFVLILLLLSCKIEGKEEGSHTEVTGTKTGVYLKKVYGSGEDSLNYRILYPQGFDVSEAYPLLIFLHGSGERGADNKSQLTHGGELIKNQMDSLQGIAVFPQCPREDYWVNILEIADDDADSDGFEIEVDKPATPALQSVMDLIQSLRKKDFVDNSRIYVAGLSMGGMGTFELLWRMPNTFAAASAICGAGAPEKAGEFAQLPLRIYHGEDDSVVSVEESMKMVSALLTTGGQPEVILYPEVDHNSWDYAFAEPDFLTWMFEKRKE